MLGEIVRRHATQDIVGNTAGTGFIDDHFGEARCHGNGHFNIERHLAVVGTGSTSVPVQQHIRQRDTGKTGLRFVRSDVSGVVAIEFEQAYRLAGAGAGYARNVRRAKIGTHVGAAGSRASCGCRVRALCEGSRLEAHRMRDDVVIQSADVEHGNSEVDRRLGIWSVKCTGFRRVSIHAHRHMQSLFNIGDRSTYVQHDTIGMQGGNPKPVRLREIDHDLVILKRWPKHLGELRGFQVAMVIGAGGVVKLLK